MVARLAKLVAVLVEARPSEQPGQVVRGGARARMTSGVMDHADQVKPVFQWRDVDPTSSAGDVALKERWALGVDSVAARGSSGGGCDVLWQDLQVQIAHQCLVREGVMWAVDQRGRAVVQLAGLVVELRVAARAEKAAGWWKAAGRDQAMKVETAFTAVADQHGVCALRAVAQGTGQVSWDRGQRI